MVDQEKPRQIGRRKWLPRGCGSCLVLALLLEGMPFYWPAGCNVIEAATWPVDHARFDSEAWRQADPWDPECLRGGMVWELLVKRTLSGMTRGEVEDLLGPPDALGDQWLHEQSEDAGDATDAMQAASWEYGIGACSGFRIDYDFLVLEFGEDGRVRRYYTYQG